MDFEILVRSDENNAGGGGGGRMKKQLFEGCR
jgi:hypothetical protein